MRMRTMAHKEIEDKLFLWFKRVRSANFLISSSILEEKAKEISSRIEDFRDHETLDAKIATCREESLEELRAEVKTRTRAQVVMT
ncbi:hypothetical protein HPB52_023601 [Rhipicephalus sanguineus]|uniref:HTH CENPB-type domain-containing protein n=1 Tax=Rhipicephalus sanguineus TaxID=34632 RepID=A0A9D4SVA8_RHISA|nr:hypothetical protein HPB52_023601 [Rhipicephalus sanguineus]